MNVYVVRYKYGKEFARHVLTEFKLFLNLAT